jgi:hypothetical protein
MDVHNQVTTATVFGQVFAVQTAEASAAGSGKRCSRIGAHGALVGVFGAGAWATWLAASKELI